MVLMKQNYSSMDTSINSRKAPAIYNKLNKLGLMNNATIIDYGCGKYTSLLRETAMKMGAKEIKFFDPFNIPELENFETKVFALYNDVDIVIMSNVINVIDTDSSVEEAVINALSLSKYNTVYITVYQGNKSGLGKQTKPDCYQRNMTTKMWLSWFSEHGFNARMKGGMIVVSL